MLWVRESFRTEVRGNRHTGEKFDVVMYRADSPWRPEFDVLRYKPSIHMPRGFSRLTLRLTDLRIERLHQISEADALAEGSTEPSLVEKIGACWSERDAYAKLWEHINGKGSWTENPWVWVLDFTVEQRNVNAILRAAA